MIWGSTIGFGKLYPFLYGKRQINIKAKISLKRILTLQFNEILLPLDFNSYLIKASK